MLAGVAVDAVFDSVSVATTFKGKLEELGIIFCSFSEAVKEHPELVKKYIGSVVPRTDNFYAALNSAVFSDGSFVYIPEGRSLPDGAVDVLPHQRRQHRPVRAHAHRGREGRVRVLPRGLHRADARREPAPRRDRRDRRDGRCRGEVQHGPELVPRRRGRQGRHLQLRDQARRVPRRPLEDLVDAGRNRLGDHVEVSERAPAGR